MMKLYKDPERHSHYWIANGELFESYRTIRGMRFRYLMSVPGMTDNDRLIESEILEVETKYLTE